MKMIQLINRDLLPALRPPAMDPSYARMVWLFPIKINSQLPNGSCIRGAEALIIAQMDILRGVQNGSGGPLYARVVDAVAGAIASGTLQIGERLPSERDLAQQLGMSRTTAVNAYRELEARGQVGRGTVVTATVQPADAPFAWRGKVAQGAERACDPVFRSLVAGTAPNTISFAPGVSALDSFPLDRFRRCMDEVLRRDAEEALGLAPTEGHPQLRRVLGRRLDVAAERVLVLAGAQQGLDLVARCLLDPGDVVVMDRPGYLGAIQVFRAAGARLVGWDAANPDLDQLEDILLRYRPKFLYTTPTFGNPTGRTLSLTLRRDLLQLAARYHLPIVEDDPYAELYFSQPPPHSLHELDEQQLVIHIETFSKTLAAGLRLGWLVAAEAIVDQLALIKGRSDLFTSTPNQLVVAEMVTSRLFDSHLKVLRAEHARRY